MLCQLYRALMCGRLATVGSARDLRLHAVSDVLCRIMRIVFLFIFCAVILPSVAARATTLVIPYISAAPGTMIEIPVTIDQVENLAGIKLVLSYDKTALTYVKAVKAKAASSLMHVVNDRKPGQLIIVMAGARGINGKNMTLMTLTFAINPKISEKIKKIIISVNEIQVMDDRLKEVECVIKSGGIGIVREKNPSNFMEEKNE